jgi:hypothetical protein
LITNTTRKGFFKCAGCFNLSGQETPRWIKQAEPDPEMNLIADFLTTEVLDIKRGEIIIGLDFSVGTGNLAA